MRRASRCVARKKHGKPAEKRGYRDPRISLFSVLTTLYRLQASTHLLPAASRAQTGLARRKPMTLYSSDGAELTRAEDDTPSG